MSINKEEARFKAPTRRISRNDRLARLRLETRRAQDGTRTSNQDMHEPAEARWSSANGSDLFITAGFPPAIKVDGKITRCRPNSR